jgi:nitroreductase
MSSFAQAMDFRHACKKFDATRQIPDEQFNQILEFARLSPSSFGMEAWRFVVVQTPELREQLKACCWNQAQVTDSSHVVVILAKTAAVKAGSDYVKAIFKRRNLPDDQYEAYLTRYGIHQATEVEPYMSLYAWSAKQCYIALANMMTGAASLGIDSCPMEGFVKLDVESLLNIDTTQYEVAVVVAFGYRAGEQPAHLRQPIEAMLEYR